MTRIIDVFMNISSERQRSGDSPLVASTQERLVRLYSFEICNSSIYYATRVTLDKHIA